MTDTSQYVQLLNFSGCGNTTNANNPIMKKLIIDSLRMCAGLKPCPCSPVIVCSCDPDANTDRR
jgi:hypothetical protein